MSTRVSIYYGPEGHLYWESTEPYLENGLRFETDTGEVVLPAPVCVMLARWWDENASVASKVGSGEANGAEGGPGHG